MLNLSNERKDLKDEWRQNLVVPNAFVISLCIKLSDPPCIDNFVS